MSDYKPQKGDRVRVVIEDVVIASADAEGTFETKNNWFEGTEGHVVSVEEIEPAVEVFQPGDVVRDLGDYIKGQVLVLGEGGYLNLTLGGGFHEYEKNRSQADITSEKYELVNRL